MNSWLIDGSAYNPRNCRADIRNSRTTARIGGAIANDIGKEVLKEIGVDYTKDPFYRKLLASRGGRKEEADSTFAIYLSELARNDSFLAKALHAKTRN